MNWPLLMKAAPMAMRMVRAVVEGVMNNESDEEIRKRASAPDVILREDLDDLRAARTDLDDYVRSGS